jgi:hypothetical protein
MFTAYLVTGGLLAVMLAGCATVDFVRNQQSLITMAKVGVPESWLTTLGILHAAGALGLLVGIRVPVIGWAAAVGVILYFVGAIVTHLRAREYTLAPPVVFLLVAMAALVLRLASS